MMASSHNLNGFKNISHCTGSKKKKQKKQKKNKNNNHAEEEEEEEEEQEQEQEQEQNDIWDFEDETERQRIREFWVGLSQEERRALVKLEKETILKKVKEQQKLTCACAVCGRRRFGAL